MCSKWARCVPASGLPAQGASSARASSLDRGANVSSDGLSRGWSGLLRAILLIQVRRFVAWSVVAALSLAACTTAGSGTASPTEVVVASGTASAAVGGAAAGPSSEIGTPAEVAEPLRLVTLGDAYTAGTDTIAPKRDSWPAQLVQAMERGDVRLRLVDNLADSGKTSQDVLDEQVPQVESLHPDVVTLQVGVNDIIAQEFEDYRTNISLILDALLLIVPPGQLFAITTPDHTLTERGGDWGPREAGRAAVDEANAALQAVAQERGITVIDISEVNERVTDDASLVIDDGPYPTAKQYAGWVEAIGPQMRRVLAAREPLAGVEP